MLSLLGDHRPCCLFRQLFLRQLPEKLRAPLANSPHSTDPRALAHEADKLLTSLGLERKVCDKIQSRSVIEVDTNCYYHLRFGSNARRRENSCKHFSTFSSKKKQESDKASRK